MAVGFPVSTPHSGGSFPLNFRVQRELSSRVWRRKRPGGRIGSGPTEIRITPFLPLGEDAELKKRIKLRNLCYRHEAGGQDLEYKTLAERIDTDSLFLDFHRGSQLIHSFRCNPKGMNVEETQFAMWSQLKWTPWNTHQLARGCTRPDVQHYGLYAASAALMVWTLGVNCERTPKAAVMLSVGLEKKAPKLLELFSGLGFRRLSVKDVTRKELSAEEIAANAFSCECGYAKPILLSPWEIDLTAPGVLDRAAIYFGEAAKKIEARLKLPVRLSLDELVTTLAEFEDRP